MSKNAGGIKLTQTLRTMRPSGANEPREPISSVCSKVATGTLEELAAIFCRDGVQTVFIVQGKHRATEGIVKVVKASREEALKAANDFLNQGLPFVTIIGDGLVYTIEEFALTFINDRTPAGHTNPD